MDAGRSSGNAVKDRLADCGPEYTSFNDGRLAGGFRVEPEVTAGGPLVVLYSTNLGGIEARVTDCGGQLSARYSSFPADNVFTSPIRAATSWRFGRIDVLNPMNVAIVARQVHHARVHRSTSVTAASPRQRPRACFDSVALFLNRTRRFADSSIIGLEATRTIPHLTACQY